MKKIIGVDGRYALLKAREFCHPYFPYRPFRDFVAGDSDQVVEMFVTAHQPPALSDDPEEIARLASTSQRLIHALQEQGCRVLPAPAKRTPHLTADGRPALKSSDDQVLMIRLALTCMRLKPDFLVLVAADGDFAPLVMGLREEGVRTEIVADADALASDLRRVAFNWIDLRDLLHSQHFLPHRGHGAA